MKEKEIRPTEIFGKYLRLVVEDKKTYFREVEELPINCPAKNG